MAFFWGGDVGSGYTDGFVIKSSALLTMEVDCLDSGDSAGLLRAKWGLAQHQISISIDCGINEESLEIGADLHFGSK